MSCNCFACRNVISDILMYMPKGKKCNTENDKININGNEIKRVNFTKFLGIYIDEHLSFYPKKLHAM